MIGSRRDFLSCTGGLLAAAFLGADSADASSRTAPPNGYGPLIPDPRGVLDLPEGFSYTIVSTKGEIMDDGFYVPANCDGMGAFSLGKHHTLIVRNHELAPGTGVLSPFGFGNELLHRYDSSLSYDVLDSGNPCPGCTTTLIYDTRHRRVRKQYLGITGTLRNCSGGVTPWGTWISCEETEQSANDTYTKDHGYCFEVDPFARHRNTPAVPLVAMGRFVHEAVCVTPNGIVYQTEDNAQGLFYRFIPDTPGDLLGGGRLQALRIVEMPSAITNNWASMPVFSVGEKLTVDWIDLDDVTAQVTPLRQQGFAKGSAQFTRGEGIAQRRQSVFFTCTDGGNARVGQLWKYVPSPYEGTANETQSPAKLVLVLEPNDANVFENADNITFAPWGHMLLCEDGTGDQYIRGVGPRRNVYTFARNAHSTSELTGPVFSPDGTTFFVNMQREGITLAITGPWTS